MKINQMKVNDIQNRKYLTQFSALIFPGSSPNKLDYYNKIKEKWT